KSGTMNCAGDGKDGCKPVNPICARFRESPTAPQNASPSGFTATRYPSECSTSRPTRLTPSACDHSQTVTFMPYVPDRATSAFAFVRLGAVHVPRVVEPAVYGQ